MLALSVISYPDLIRITITMSLGYAVTNPNFKPDLGPNPGPNQPFHEHSHSQTVSKMLAAVGNYTTVIVVFTTVVTTNPKVTSVWKEHRSLKGHKLRAAGKK